MTSIKEALQEQKDIIKQQDEQLDQLGKTIGTVKQIAITINEELDEHAILLNKLDADVDKSASKLKSATNKVVSITKKVGDPWCVCALVVVFLLMFVLVLVFALS